MRHTLFGILYFLGCVFICRSTAQVIPGDSLALVDLYNATNGPHWHISYNWLSSNPVATWYGVQVSGGRVTQLGFPMGNNLQGPLPASIGNLTALQSLGFGRNQITSVPPEIGNLTSLRALSLAYNQISFLPSTITNLVNLVTLDVSGNGLSSLPEQTGSLLNLETLYIEGNLITVLPPSIGNLVLLRTLNAMSNRLGTLPPQIASLRRMKFLYLGGNALTQLPVAVCSLDSLELLWLFSNQLPSLPEEIGNLTRLRTLHFQGNALQSLPSTIGNLGLLENLHLGENQLRALPPEIGNLTSLQSLRIFYNQLDSLPGTIGNLTSLRDLWLQHNNLVSLPPGIGNLINVTHLWLDDNNLSGPFPDTLGNLSNLVLLSLRNNRLSGAVPERLGHLTALGWLFLENNRLDGLPSFAAAPLLRVLSVYYNRLTFEDIEPNIGLPFTSFIYAPQDSVGEERDTTLRAGSAFELFVSVGGNANRYQWFKDNVAIPGADSSSFRIPAVDSSHAGAYVCRVTNNVVPNLSIYSRPVTLLVQGSVFAEETGLGLPLAFYLGQNYPNPFNPSTHIPYSVRGSGFVSLKVFDVLGREVATLVNEVKQPGIHSAVFDGTNLPSGVYFYRLTGGEHVQTKTMVHLK
jgi:Leucine-rich repeat (LRR) protein